MVKPIRSSFLPGYFINFYNFFVIFTPLTKNRGFTRFQCFSSILQAFSSYRNVTSVFPCFQQICGVFVHFASFQQLSHRYERFSIVIVDFQSLAMHVFVNFTTLRRFFDGYRRN